MVEKARLGKTVVGGTIGDDTHALGHKLLFHALREEGFNTVALGSMVEPEEFIKAAIETDADAILITSVAGHAELYCRDIRKMCEEAGLTDIILYVGGNIVIGKQEWEPVELRFKEMGFNRAYPPGTLPQDAIQDLKGDLGVVE